MLFGAYKLGRLLANGRVTEAFDNAHRVWRLERVLGLPGETGVQHGLLHSEFLVHAANSYYAYVHFPATGLFLLWIYLRRPSTTGGCGGSSWRSRPWRSSCICSSRWRRRG